VVATVTTAMQQGCRVLVLTPWTAHAERLAEACGGVALTSDLADGARFAAWSGFLRGNVRCLVATRIGAWLATEADLVIVDEPENDDHKQDELAPRYDARWIAAEAKRADVPVLAIGLTPRIVSPTPIPSLADSPVTWVDTHRADWSGVAGVQGRTLLAMEQAMDAGHAVHVIHPIHGTRARLRCADCGWSAHCVRCGGGLTPSAEALACRRCAQEAAMPSACPSCGGTDFSKSRLGRDTLIRDLAKRELQASVHSLGEWHTASVRLAPQSLVVFTDLSLLPGMAEDVRRRERLIIGLRRLVDLCTSQDSHLMIQGDPALLDDARTWMTPEGCAAALQREWDERKAFHLPPAVRLVKLIVRGAPSNAETLAERLRHRLPREAAVAGPFTVERLPGTRAPRAIIHATFPPSTPDSAIQTALSPLLSDTVLVDLDPIAFFE
jgi:primosomal protein N'